MPDAIITSTASTFGTITGTFAAALDLKRQGLAIGQGHIKDQRCKRPRPSGAGQHITLRVQHHPFTRGGRRGMVLDRGTPSPAHHQHQQGHDTHNREPDAQVQVA